MGWCVWRNERSEVRGDFLKNDRASQHLSRHTTRLTAQLVYLAAPRAYHCHQMLVAMCRDASMIFLATRSQKEAWFAEHERNNPTIELDLEPAVIPNSIYKQRITPPNRVLAALLGGLLQNRTVFCKQMLGFTDTSMQPSRFDDIPKITRLR